MVQLWHRFRPFIYSLTGVYWLTLLTATHLPPRDMPNTHVSDKIEHMSAYGLLAVLLSLCVAPRVAGSWRVSAGLLALLAAYGAFDEKTQPFFGRTCDIHDWYADMIGSTLSLLIAAMILRAIWRKPAQ